jgi:hypothetical protein
VSDQQPGKKASNQIGGLILFDKINKNDINDEFVKSRIHLNTKHQTPIFLRGCQRMP